MGDTTISISSKFHEWLESKGKKGESYEDVIKKLLKPNLSQELGTSNLIKKKSLKQVEVKRNLPQQKTVKVAGIGNINSKNITSNSFKKQVNLDPNRNKKKPLQKPILPKKIPQTQFAVKPKKSNKLGLSKKPVTISNKGVVNDEVNQWKNEKKLELDHLKIELQLAKLSNDEAKKRELAVSITKLKEELDQNNK